MPPEALKCQITVQAGIVPGVPLEQHTRAWSIPSETIEACEANPQDYRFMDTMGAANNYMAYLQNPRMVNWVKCEWIWL